MRPVLTLQGRGLGGSSTLYAAALGRLKRSDFEASAPGRSAQPALPDAWPIDYDSFKSYYERAERLMRVRGGQDPLDPDDDEPPPAPPPLSPSAEEVRAALQRNNLHPYRLRVAIDYLPGCRECFGFRCERDCKADGYNRALHPALASGFAKIEAETTALEIAEERGGVRVIVRDIEGRIGERRAAHLVLAAGALNTPLLLDRSAALWSDTPRPPMLGRGLMFHVSDSFVVQTAADDGSAPRKWLGLRDFYDDGEHDVGEIQSTGVNVQTGAIMQMIRARAAATLPPPLRAMAEFLRPAAWAIAKIIGNRAVYATITEDLPHAANCVREIDGAIVVDYAVDPLLKKRAKRMRAPLRKAFAPWRLRFLKRPGVPNWGHPMGTCRMGTDPATSVITPECRVHGHDRVFVADASAFPSSGGTGPGLTVLALALRVADQVAAAAPRRVKAADEAAP
jgi:choline dehydrogenase-like flavoprotein